MVETPIGCDAQLGQCTGSARGTDRDAMEVQTKTVGGNLICQGNTPAAQVNPDDGGQPNDVSGRKIGQCANL